MQTEQLILQRLDALSLQLDEITRHQRAIDELVEEMTPIAREALGAAIARLDVLDKQGLFASLAELAQLARALVRPDVLRIAGAAATALGDAEHAKPLGAFKAVRATRDNDVQRGLGLLVEMLRHIGHDINAAAEHDRTALDQKAKLAELLGPRRVQRLLPAPARAARPAAQPTPRHEPEGAIDPGAWTRAIGEGIARDQGVALDQPRWAVIDAARADFEATHASPNIQRLTQVARVTTKDLYQLFPKAPARTVARIAGLPKPAGCL